MSTLVNATIEKKTLGIVMQASEFSGIEGARELLDKSGLRAELFAVPEVRDAFSAVCALLNQNRPALPAAVNAIAIGSESLKKAGGEKYLFELWNDVTHEADLGLHQYAETIRQLAILRRCSEYFQRASNKASIPTTDAAAMLAEVRVFLDGASAAVREYRTCAEDSFTLLERIDANLSGKRETVLPTGIDLLDAEIGGFRPTLTAIGGSPGTGKSALIGTIIGNMAARGVHCGLFGLEDGTQWVTDRLVARESRVPLSDLDSRRLTSAEMGAVQEAQGVVSNWMQYVEKCSPEGRMKPADLVAQAKDWVMNRGVRCVFVDHIGELEHGGARDRFDLSIAESLSQLRSIATNHGVPVIIAAHLKRDAEASTPRPPTMFDFAESAYIERMSRLALGIWNGDSPETMNVTVMKFTHGASRTTVQLRRATRAALVVNSGRRRDDRQRELLEEP